MFTKIISGGQTGVDRAALDVALELGIECGGWCPRGRRAEDGPVAERYPLQETSWDGYPQRTTLNVRDSDGTLILKQGEADRGTLLTIQMADRKRKPLLILDLETSPDVESVRAWAREHTVAVLNVAGPRESSRPGIYLRAQQFLLALLTPPLPPNSNPT